MKNALILHGTDGNSQQNWFPWLKSELEKDHWQVWVPDLPHAEKPNSQIYNQHIFNNNWNFNQNSIIIGHSSGAVALLGLLQQLPPNIKIDTCYLIGSFKNDLGWEALSDLFLNPFDFPTIKTKAKHFIFIHSDNDPYCPLDHAKFLATQLNGKLIIKKNQQHFSINSGGPKYSKFPFLLKLIQNQSSLH